MVKHKYPGDEDLLNLLRQVHYLTRRVEATLSGADLEMMRGSWLDVKRSCPSCRLNPKKKVLELVSKVRT